MVRESNFTPVAAYIFIAAMLIFILLTPTIILAQQGNDWGGKEGKIDAWADSCEILVETIELPSHPQHLLNCRYEWRTRVNDTLKAGIFGYVDCNDMNVFKFEPPIEADSFEIQKRVFWHNSSGTKWRTTKRVTVFPDCSDNLIIDPPTDNPIHLHSEKVENCSVKIETKIPAVIVIWNSLGFFAYIDIAPGVHEIQLDQYAGNLIRLIYSDGYERAIYCNT